MASVSAFSSDRVALLRWYMAATESKAWVNRVDGEREKPVVLGWIDEERTISRYQLASRRKQASLTNAPILTQREPMLPCVLRLQLQRQLVSRKQRLGHGDGLP
eukprot:4264486-Pleurochrysis_carterae.AAC.1